MLQPGQFTRSAGTFLMIGTFFLLGACTNMQSAWHDGLDAGSRFGLLPAHELERSSRMVFPVSAGFYVSWREEIDWPAETPAQPIEASAAFALYQQVSRRFPRTDLAHAPESVELARLHALARSLDYVIVPRVLYLNDAIAFGNRMTYAAGSVPDSVPVAGASRDRAQLQLVVYDAYSGRIVDTVLINSQAGLLTKTGETPQRLLDNALAQYVDSVFPAAPRVILPD